MLAPWKESSDKPTQLITKQRHHFANEDPSSQSYGFTSSRVQMWELDLKKSEHQRTDAFKLWWQRRLLRVPWTARRSNHLILKKSILNIHWKDLCWSSNTLATWCEDLTLWKRPFWERLRQEEKGMIGWDDWMVPWWTQWTWIWANSQRWWRTGKSGMLQSMEPQRVGHDWAAEQQPGG